MRSMAYRRGAAATELLSSRAPRVMQRWRGIGGDMAIHVSSTRDGGERSVWRCSRCNVLAKPRLRSAGEGIKRRTAGIAPARHRQAGFTLVEVIVAIAILSVALSGLLAAIGNALRQTAQSDRMAEAGSLAQSLLARLGPEVPLGERHDVGQSANGFRWRLNCQGFGDANDRQQWPMSAYEVSIEVSWNDGFRERSFTLTTLRLAPKELTR